MITQILKAELLLISAVVLHSGTLWRVCDTFNPSSFPHPDYLGWAGQSEIVVPAWALGLPCTFIIYGLDANVLPVTYAFVFLTVLLFLDQSDIKCDRLCAKDRTR